MASSETTTPTNQALAPVVLSPANAPQAETWNFLRMNGRKVTVPAPRYTGAIGFALPAMFDRISAGIGRPFTDWVRASSVDAVYYEVPARTERPEPIVIALDASKGEVRDTGVMVRQGARATVVVAVSAGSRDVLANEKLAQSADENPEVAATNTTKKADLDIEQTAANLLRISVEAGAELHLIELVGVDDNQQHLDSVGIVAEKGAHVDVKQYALGGGNVFLGIETDLKGDDAALELSCRYHAHQKDKLDINQLTHMHGKRTQANNLSSGVLDDAAEKTLRATINLVYGAAEANGNEAETVMIMSDKVINKTMPVILCDEDDVAGNHGATIGSISPEQLAYLASRGLSRHAAEGLFVRALFEDAIIHAPENLTHGIAIARAEAVLGSDVAHDFDASEATTLEADTSGSASHAKTSSHAEEQV